MGTYVSTDPPHLNRYALAFATKPDRGYWSRHYESLIKAAAVVEAERGITITPRFDIDGHIDSIDFLNLVDEIAEQRIAGIYSHRRHFWSQILPCYDGWLATYCDFPRANSQHGNASPRQRTVDSTRNGRDCTVRTTARCSSRVVTSIDGSYQQ